MARRYFCKRCKDTITLAKWFSKGETVKCPNCRTIGSLKRAEQKQTKANPTRPAKGVNSFAYPPKRKLQEINVELWGGQAEYDRLTSIPKDVPPFQSTSIRRCADPLPKEFPKPYVSRLTNNEDVDRANLAARWHEIYPELDGIAGDDGI
jgi:hypothetical protein